VQRAVKEIINSRMKFVFALLDFRRQLPKQMKEKSKIKKWMKCIPRNPT